MRKYFYICLVIAIYGFTASSINHTVLVEVNAINELEILGGNLTLTINTATAGSNPDAQSNSSACDLEWTTNRTSKKITIVSNIASPTNTLTVLADNVSGGTSAGSITISNSVQDLITAIAETVGVCDLNYTASTTASNGTSSDVHTITYTLTGV